MHMWRLLSECLSPEILEAVHAGTIELAEVPEYAPKIIDGQVAGRLLVEVR